MSNDEFIKRLSDGLNMENKDSISEIVASLCEFISESLQSDKSISLKDFGDFTVLNEKEYIAVNQSTNQRILVPPALKISFSPAESFINKINVI